jgi:hypothetical protein
VALVLIFVVSLLMLVYFVRSPMIIFFNVALALGGCYCVHGYFFYKIITSK